MTFRSALYRGELMHARHDAIKRAFRYPVYMAALDLDELPALDRELRLFSHRRRNLFSFDDRDYSATLSPSTLDASSNGAPSTANGATSTGARSTSNGAHRSSLLESLAALRAANGIAEPATTRLVTNLRVAGYVFNPVSFFLDYDAKGSLSSVIAEVNNTYGGRLRYVLGPRERLDHAASRGVGKNNVLTGSPREALAGLVAGRRYVTNGDEPITNGHEPIANGANDRVGFRHVRELFVSPFLHGEATYDFWFDAPLDGDDIAIEMHVHQPDVGEMGSDSISERRREKGSDPISRTRSFTARFMGARAAMSDRTLAAAALRYPFMTAQVIGLIHYEAIKMRIAGVPYRRPGADHRPLAADR
jgi:DUF1365 family protein